MPPTPLPLSEIPTISLLYKLKHLAPALQPGSLPKASQTSNQVISLIRTDITALKVGAIVNAANTSLLGGGGVDGAIHSKAGPGLLDECRTLKGCKTGSAKITGGHRLPADHVIHTVGPVYWSAKEERPGLEKELLRGCYRTSLDLASENGCKSIAFSAISTGIYGYPSGEAAQDALTAVKAWMDEKDEGLGGLERIIFCCFERKDEIAYTQWLPQFFPPTEHDLSSASSDTQDDKLKGMPDPPKSDPAREGEPDAKKQKTTAVPSGASEDWEHVEVPPESDINGYPDVTREIRSTSMDEDVMTGEDKEQKTAALHTAQVGGDPPMNALEKDW